MSRESVTQFANALLTDESVQRDLQNAVNDFASSLVDAGQKRGYEFSVEELGSLLPGTFFSDGSTPETPAHDRRQWAPVIQKVLCSLKVSNPDHKMFQTMTFDSVGGSDDHLRELLAQAAQNKQDQAPEPVAAKVEADVDAFEPEDTYFDATTASLSEIEEARRRMQADEASPHLDKPFWKVW